MFSSALGANNLRKVYRLLISYASLWGCSLFQADIQFEYDTWLKQYVSTPKGSERKEQVTCNANAPNSHQPPDS